MSRKLRRAINNLEHETAMRVQTVRGLLMEYREFVRGESTPDVTPRVVRQTQEMDRTIAEYVKLQKQLRRLRRKA